jgi:RsmE family RNA methyltransferase
VNLVLLDEHEAEGPLGPADPRSRHILEVLRRGPGDRFDAGIVDGPIGQATLLRVDTAGLHVHFEPRDTPPPLPPIHLLVGLPRPATARDILRDGTTCGFASLRFVQTERGQASYADSRLWRSDEWRACLRAGAAQAFDTRLPLVTVGEALEAALAGATGTRVALDNYEASAHLANVPRAPGEVWLAVGPERGWGPRDRRALADAGFILGHLGRRVLRVEMAVVAAHALLTTPA